MLKLKDIEMFMQNLMLPFGVNVRELAYNGQNCFGFVLGLERVLDREEFVQMLGKENYLPIGSDMSLLRINDITVYHETNPDLRDGFMHAGIYRGRKIIRSKFGPGGRIIDHPLLWLPVNYREFGVSWEAFRLQK